MKMRYCSILIMITMTFLFFITGCEGTAFDITEDANSGLKIYAVGGCDGYSLSSVEAYDPYTDKWKTKKSMSVTRYVLAAVVADGLIYAIGGQDGSGTNLSSIEAYNPVTDTWTNKTSMSGERGELAAVAVKALDF